MERYFSADSLYPEKNSSNALYYFALGLPAFSIIKIFSSFLFARHNTKIPFYFSLFSVIINIIISVYFFNKIGFIIIPIATTISSWVNALLLLIYLINKKYFSISLKFFSQNLTYNSEYKLMTIISLVIATFIIYILISILTKAFKTSDIKLRY